jgi:hypothetical protein
MAVKAAYVTAIVPEEHQLMIVDRIYILIRPFGYAEFVR